MTGFMLLKRRFNRVFGAEAKSVFNSRAYLSR